MRKSLKLRSRRKDKEKDKLPSGITADYSANFFRSLERDSIVSHPNGFNASPADSPTESLESKLNSPVGGVPSTNTPPAVPSRPLPLPPLPPRASKKSLNSMKVNYRHSIGSDSSNDPSKSVDITTNSQSSHNSIRPNSSFAVAEDVIDFAKSNWDIDGQSSLMPPSVYVSHYDKSNMKSPSIESLTDSTTNSSFATPPFSSSPVGEGQGYYCRFPVVLLNSSPEDARSEFPLPKIEPIRLPPFRELTISRKTLPKNDFGFSLSRVMTIDRTSAVGSQIKFVILAEMNRNDLSESEVGLLPGDQLLEVNGVSVIGKTREEIVELIKSSDSQVKIKVNETSIKFVECIVSFVKFGLGYTLRGRAQLIIRFVQVQLLPELSELSRRCCNDGTSIELDDTNIKCGTLKRSGSKRFRYSNVSTYKNIVFTVFCVHTY